jgi:predicted transcriptional regulator
MTLRSTASLKLDSEMKARVDRLAELRRRTPHWIMREAVQEYVEREEKREQFLKDTLAAWEEFQATGLHITGEEANAWMKRLAAGEDVEPPKSHR